MIQRGYLSAATKAELLQAIDGIPDAANCRIWNGHSWKPAVVAIETDASTGMPILFLMPAESPPLATIRHSVEIT